MITLTINGSVRSVDADPDMPLLWALRDVMQMTGTKFGCGAGLCGACTVHIDGAADPVVHHADLLRRRRQGHDDRGPNRQCIERGARRLAKARRRPMRLLSVRPDHERGGARQPESKAE